jgi:NAD(P)H-dependent nitrite reductase small subunit
MWIEACAESDIDEDLPKAVILNGVEIGLFKLGDELFALEDVCPHAYALLSQGFVEGEEVECPLHGAIFNIRTGKCLKEPGERDLKTYPVRVENGTVLVDMP